MVVLLLNIPVVQRKMTLLIADELAELLNTELTIGKVDIGLLNRIIIDDVQLKDRSGGEMLKVTRLSAKFEITALLKGKISINSVQLFGFSIVLNKQTPEAIPNFQFVLDALASKDTVDNKKTNIDLRINSILIRRGRLSYDVLSEPQTPGKFNVNHINVQNIIANISLKSLNKDSINGHIKRLSLDEQSGFELNKLSLKILANNDSLRIENFAVNLPNTSINMDTIRFRYDSFDAFSNFKDDVFFEGNMLPSLIALEDISAFVPSLSDFHDKLQMSFSFVGPFNQLNCPKLELNAGEDIHVQGNVSFQDLSRGNEAFVFGDLSRLYISHYGMDYLVKNLSANYTGTPRALQQFGNISFHGNITGYFNDLVTYGTFNTSLGVIQTDVMVSSNVKNKTLHSSGDVKSTNFELGKLISSKNLGRISFGLNVKTEQYLGQMPKIKMEGLISSIEFNEYEYNNITLDGMYEKGGFDGEVKLEDQNGTAILNGSFSTATKIPEFNFHADFRKVRPHDLKLTDQYQDSEFSLKLHANFAGSSIDDMDGEINVDSFLYIAPSNYYYLDNLNLKAYKSDNENHLKINSDFLKAEIKGDYSYRTIPASIIKTVERYIPSLLSINREIKEPNNNFSFDIQVYNTTILSEVFGIPLNTYSPSSIKGYFNDVARKLRIEGYFPSFRYGQNRFESGMILCENPSENFQCKIRASNVGKNAIMNIALNTQAQHDQLKTTINWGNNAIITNNGSFSAITNFFKTEGENPILQANIEIEPSNFVLNDSVWSIHPARVEVDSGRVFVDHFFVRHNEQFLSIDGRLSDEPTDTVKVALKDIDLEYIFDIVRLRAVDFTGAASGTLFVNQALKSPEMNTTLFVKDLALNNGLLGDAHISGKWDAEEGGVLLNADIREGDLGKTQVEGHILIQKGGLDLRIDGNGTNIKFIEEYVGSIISDINGRVYGKARLYGGFSSLNLDGNLLADASLKVNLLNTTYSLRDTVRLSPEGIRFNNITIRDPQNHTGLVNGQVLFRHFKNMNYQIGVDAYNLLVYNTQETPDMPFYGTVYGSGNVILNGNPTRLDVDVNMNTNRNTNFVYLLSSTESAINNQFISFVDKTPKRSVYDLPLVDTKRTINETEEEETPIDIRLNLQIDATPDGNMKIIMDPVSGDYISGKGTGNIRVEFYNKGDVKMFGRYTIDQGVYKFSLQEVIRKDFAIQSGSAIDFNGNPSNADLDIRAVYTVNSASLNDLGLGSEFTQNSVRVNCIMDIAGNLDNPAVRFDIELPNVKEEERQIVRSAISTEEQMSMQIIYLLGIGKFYTYDYGGSSGQSSNAMSSVLSSTLSGQINNMLGHILDVSNWNFGTSVSTGDRGWTDFEVEGMLSGQLLNNRLLINGNFGYRENTMTSNSTNFVGDFDIEYLLTKSGDIRLKAYNQTNDNRFLTRTALTTQGVGIVYKKDFNTWRDIISFIRKREKKKEAEEQKEEEMATTLLLPQTTEVNTDN